MKEKDFYHGGHIKTRFEDGTYMGTLIDTRKQHLDGFTAPGEGYVKYWAIVSMGIPYIINYSLLKRIFPVTDEEFAAYSALCSISGKDMVEDIP
jgi:hypothetical protein